MLLETLHQLNRAPITITATYHKQMFHKIHSPEADGGERRKEYLQKIHRRSSGIFLLETTTHQIRYLKKKSFKVVWKTTKK